LNISPSSVLCGEDSKFSVSFRYDDPQGDIAKVTVTRQRSGETSKIEESPSWPEDQSRGTGTVKFENFFFTCDSKGGVWTIKVLVEDDRGHTSNELSGEIRLNAAG
jgi:hypothetical protein